MDAIVATVVDGGRAIVVIYIEGVEINYFSCIFLIMLEPFDGGLVQPLAKRLSGVGCARPTKPCHWRGKRLHHGEDVCVLVFS
jgi:hypothetical protein